MVKTVILGGMAGGATAAARLRRLDENAEIVILERGAHISLASCGLAYYIGGVIPDREALVLQTPESFSARFNVDVRVFSEVLSINPALKTVAVKDHKTGGEYTEHYDKLIISSGAEQMKPPIHGVDIERIFTLRSLPDAVKIKKFIEDENPKSAVVVGGGYIGVEMAENLSSMGIEVTIVEMLGQILSVFDHEMVCAVQNYIRSKGVKLMLGRTVKSVSENEGKLAITLDEGKLTADMLILSAGVTPESRIAKAAGIEVSGRGAISVDEGMLTSDPNIYAVGDVAGINNIVTSQKCVMPLAGPANKQGRIAADRICGLDSVYEGTQGSSIIKIFGLTAAVTGINEKTAKRLGIPYEKSYTYAANHAGYYPGSETMSLKVIFNPENGKILGAQIIGHEGVDKRCDIIAAAIRFGASAKDLSKFEHCYAPPYSNAKDPVNMAGFVIENVLDGRVKLFHWHDAGKLANGVLLDVRTPAEFGKGSIKGSVNIPLDNLRDRLGDLDREKPVYVMCQTGMRSYNACRILTQNGFDAYNLSGGYRLYSSVMPSPCAAGSEGDSEKRGGASGFITRLLRRN